MVGQRRGLLAYLKKTDIERYRALDREAWTEKIIQLCLETFILWTSLFYSRKIAFFNIKSQKPKKPMLCNMNFIWHILYVCYNIKDYGRG